MVCRNSENMGNLCSNCVDSIPEFDFRSTFVLAINEWFLPEI